MLTRRRLLSLAGLGGTAAVTGLFPRLAASDEIASDRYFVFCYFNGGWDLQLCLDPRDPGLFRDDLRRSTRIQPGYGELPSSYRDLVRSTVPDMTFGPYIGRLAEHAHELCLVKGMSMDTLTHEVGRRRFLTGRSPAGLQAQGSSLSTILAAWLGRDDPIPQLSVRVESYNDGMPGFSSAIRVTSVDDLLRALRRSNDALSSVAEAEVAASLERWEGADCTVASALRQEAHAAHRGAQTLVELGLDARFDFGAETDDMAAVRDLYGIDPRDLGSPSAQAAAAVTAITSGIARTVCIEATSGLDTHGPEWSSSHGPRLRDGFDVVAALLTDLASREYRDSGESWLDHTTVVGFSEFGRSPLLNSSGGRDHYLHNCCFLAGAGVRHGVVVGKHSDVGMAPTRTDLDTGETVPDGEIIKPEHIHRALLDSVGITEDVGEHRVAPLRAILS
jgi:uncharacterized protein (DUF1501 family)